MEINVEVNQKFTESVMFGKWVMSSRFSNDAKDKSYRYSLKNENILTNDM